MKGVAGMPGTKPYTLPWSVKRTTTQRMTTTANVCPHCTPRRQHNGTTTTEDYNSRRRIERAEQQH